MPNPSFVIFAPTVQHRGLRLTEYFAGIVTGDWPCIAIAVPALPITCHRFTTTGGRSRVDAAV